MSNGSENWLEKLDQIDKAVTLALKVGTALEPLVTGVLLGIKKIRQDDGTVIYALVIEQGRENLAEAVAAARATLEKVNAERVEAGLEPLPVPESEL